MKTLFKPELTFSFGVFLFSFEPLISVIYPQFSLLVTFYIVSLFLIGVSGYLSNFNFKLDYFYFWVLFYISFCILLSLGYGFNLFDSVKTVLYEGKYFLFCTYLLVFCRHVDFIKCSKLLFVVFLFQLIFSILQFFNILGLKSLIIQIAFINAHDYYRENLIGGGVFGSFISKNTLGYFSLFCFIIFSKYKVFDTNFKNVLVLSSCFFLILISESRSAFVFMVLFTFYLSRKDYKLLIILIAPLIILPLFFIDTEYLPKSIKEVFSQQYYTTVLDVGRGAYIYASILKFLESPILGSGAGSWGLGLAFSESSEHNKIMYYAGFSIPLGVFQDNNWLSILTQYGAVGLVGFILILKRVWVKGRINNSYVEPTLLICLCYNALFLAGFSIGILMFLTLFFNLSKNKI
jgi:hypothetical protein